MMFWIGVLVGLLIGANVGVVVAALLFSIEREKKEIYGHIEECGSPG